MDELRPDKCLNFTEVLKYDKVEAESEFRATAVTKKRNENRTCAHLGAVEPVDGCLVCGGHLAIAGVDGNTGLLLDRGEALTTNQRLVFTMIWTNVRSVSTEWTNERAVLPAAA